MAKIKPVIEKTEAEFGYVKGMSKWAKVLEVGQFGSYTIDVYGEDIENMVEGMEALRDKGAAEVEAAGKKYQLADVIKEDADGKKFIQFKLPPENFKGEAQAPTIYDKHGSKDEEWDKLIGNGSTVKVKYMAKPYYMNSTKMVGVSYKFYAVQVINLEEYSGGGELGFGDETEDGAPFDTGSGDTPKDF